MAIPVPSVDFVNFNPDIFDLGVVAPGPKSIPKT
jgi:hypothetical protein